MRAFFGIHSHEAPHTYQSVYASVAHDQQEEEQTFATGDFLADWKAAHLWALGRAETLGYERIDILYSSSADFWPVDSCEFIDVPKEEGDPLRFRRMTTEEQDAALAEYRLALTDTTQAVPPTIATAVEVRYDARTGVIEPRPGFEPFTEADLTDPWKIFRPVTGWAPYTHLLWIVRPDEGVYALATLVGGSDA